MATPADITPDIPAPSSPSSHGWNWKQRIFYPTLLAGVAGGAVGLVSRHRKVYGLSNISATYATNLAIVAGCYCGARELVRVSRKSEPGDLWNSAIGGFGSGALLGRLQGGQRGAMRYSVIFAVVGTTFDYATVKLLPIMESYRNSMSNKELKLPDWSPIQILDEEALAAKRAREQQFAAQKAITIREKES
ncbi:hypothetical protein V2J09_018441 [Rumex salicifolius]